VNRPNTLGWSWLATLVLVASCAKKGPPTGGPPDLDPPVVVATSPDSGAAGVALDARIEVTFSEGMEQRSAGDAVALAPIVDIRQRRWSGRTVSLVLAEPLRPDQTYTLFVAPSARDRHGNALVGGAARVFTTAEALPPGVIEGTVEARGLAAAGIYLWCYRQDPERAPDSTARDFDALGLADRDGRFRVVGLPVPGRYRLWAFADRNSNRSFEPERDLLVPSDTVLSLTADRPLARDVVLRVVDPKAPGRARGTVLDSLGQLGGVIVVRAVAATDTSRVRQGAVEDDLSFDLELEIGDWRLDAFRDIDRDNRLDPAEPASDTVRVTITPGLEVPGLVLVLRRPPAEP
jgi:hypothetical protein